MQQKFIQLTLRGWHLNTKPLLRTPSNSHFSSPLNSTVKRRCQGSLTLRKASDRKNVQFQYNIYMQAVFNSSTHFLLLKNK